MTEDEAWRWLQEAKRKHEWLGSQAIRVFNLHGGTHEARNHPAYRRYLAAWRKQGPVHTKARRVWNELFRERIRKENELATH